MLIEWFMKMVMVKHPLIWRMVLVMVNKLENKGSNGGFVIYLWLILVGKDGLIMFEYGLANDNVNGHS